MSRQNKVNPGMYTQRGRLTQDDAARELAKQRSIGSEHTWQPVKRDAQPRLESKTEGDDDTAVDEAGETAEETTRVTATAKPAKKAVSRKTRKARPKTTAGVKSTAAASRKVKAKSRTTPKVKAKSAKRRKS